MTGIGTALCAAISIGETGNVAPEWLHLLPAGAAQTRDGRGPYRLTDPPALIAASMAGGKLAVDENHSTDLAAPKGEPAPAHGWITELQARDDGIWGRVDWVDAGAPVPIWRRYRGISPVIAHTADFTAKAILRASLTNTPNLTGLQSLHAEEHNMDLRNALIAALGLDSEADDAAIIAAVKAKKEGGDDVALQSTLSTIATALGVAADAGAIVAGVEALKGGDNAVVTALQSELATLTTQLNTLTEAGARKDATAFVDAAIKDGRVGLKPVRDEYVAMHMADPARAAKLIGAMPILKSGTTIVDPAPKDDAVLDDPALMAAKAGAYQRKMAADGIAVDFATAVRAVETGVAA